MNKQQWFKQAIAIGMCTTIGLGTLMATGAGTAPAAAASVSSSAVTAESVSASSTGSSIVSFGKNIWVRATSSVHPLLLQDTLTALHLLNIFSRNMALTCRVLP